MPAEIANLTATPERFPVAAFRRLLAAWYRKHARELPWRGVDDPYATWVSEIMLQQTRVATVIERYNEFMRRFPTVRALAEADVEQVLAVWSGLGYYLRARKLHRAAQWVVREMGGELPTKAARLQLLPGIGVYTAAAIASLAFGESVAVVDGNVERVLLRVLGEDEDASSAGKRRLAALAQELVPAASRAKTGERVNRPGEHNQAMMELGATVCLPRGPLCGECPVVELCQTRGEHKTVARAPLKSRYVAYLLATRKAGVRTEVLLQQRPQDAGQMAGMWELPPLPEEAVAGMQPALRERHTITTTNYMVEVFSEIGGRSLHREVVAAVGELHWVDAERLVQLPLTGLARKALVKLKMMERRG